jgi:hypothetical protein
MNEHLLWLLASGLLSAAVSALWNHLSKRSLQRDDAATKVAFAKPENLFAQSERRAQAETDRSVLVTRAQFETEFEAMKEVFGLLSQVRFALYGLWPTSTYEPRGEEEESKFARLSRRLHGLMEAHDAVRTAIEAKRPFFPEDLYDTVTECLDAAQVEANGIRTADRETLYNTWFLELTPIRAKFGKGYSRAANIIRDRIIHAGHSPRVMAAHALQGGIDLRTVQSWMVRGENSIYGSARLGTP